MFTRCLWQSITKQKNITRFRLRGTSQCFSKLTWPIENDARDITSTKSTKFRGFLDHQRAAIAYRDPLERQKDWKEIYSPESATVAQNRSEEQIQAARCMDCGTPFCQTHTGCPVNNLIPEWNELVFADQWRAASERLHSTNNFPEFTGRVCPAPCEGACVAGLVTDPVAIKNIELAIVERAWEEGWIIPRVPTYRSGLSVAVVGSGPAGLAAADCLNQMGHMVSVFEREDRIGGLLTYGIPSMKLDKDAVERRVQLLACEGIRFITGVEVGSTIDARALSADYDAVVVCVGAAQPRDIAVPGRGLGGVHFAMEFLTHNQKRLFLTGSGHLEPPVATWHDAARHNQQLSPHSVLAEGCDVVVIGGGDTGTDCIGTAMRQRCRSVTNIELMSRPPDARAADNPWPQWPRVRRVDYGHAEAAARFGSDPRAYGLTVKEFLGTAEGRVRAVVTQSVDWVAPRGAGGALPAIAGTEKVWPADVVLLAMGFVSPQRSPLVDQLAIPLDQRGNFCAGSGDFSAGIDGVFVAGDCRRGQSLVVWAINEGRRVAGSCHAYLLHQKKGKEGTSDRI